MRTYVCAQCHVEYYFKGENKALTFPWEKGLKIENINDYYDEYGFKDWTHGETGAPMLKIQHPEFEMFSTSLHYRSGVACADCHMPYVREGSVKVSDHWLRSPLDNVNAACRTCHKQDEQELKDRILTIQNNTASLLRNTEVALGDAMDAIVAASRRRHRRSTRGSPPFPPQGVDALGLRDVGKQHRLPQPARGGPGAG